MKSDWRKFGDAGRQLLPQGVELAVEAACKLHGVRIRLLLHADDDGRPAVARALATLERGPFGHVCDVADEDGSMPPDGHDAVADLLRGAHTSDSLEDVLLRTFHEDAGRAVPVRAAYGREQLSDRDSVGAELLGTGDDLELTLGTADRRDL